MRSGSTTCPPPRMILPTRKNLANHMIMPLLPNTWACDSIQKVAARISGHAQSRHAPPVLLIPYDAIPSSSSRAGCFWILFLSSLTPTLGFDSQKIEMTPPAKISKGNVVGLEYKYAIRAERPLRVCVVVLVLVTRDRLIAARATSDTPAALTPAQKPLKTGLSARAPTVWTHIPSMVNISIPGSIKQSPATSPPSTPCFNVPIAIAT
mmetsp:Transcript_13871/g.20177  ORF Transcript_13871/g.20177 Transcript_13871/m.20177 type:complete len:208 (-) Transcript_13871:405-1028(-)